jgi:hypothetical protein
VTSVAVEPGGIRITGRAPAAPYRTQAGGRVEAESILLLAEWCVLDQAFQGVCAVSAHDRPYPDAGGSFGHVLPSPPRDLDRVTLVRPAADLRPETQLLSVYLRLRWGGVTEVEVERAVAKAAVVSVGADGALTPILVPQIECNDTPGDGSGGSWSPCVGDVLVGFGFADTGAASAATKIEALVGERAYWTSLFPRAAAACGWALNALSGLQDTVDQLLDLSDSADSANPDPEFVVGSAGTLVQSWQTLAAGMTPEVRSLLSRCGWQGLPAEDDLRYGEALLALVSQAEDEFATGALLDMRDLACRQAGDPCDGFVELTDRRQAAEQESAEVRRRADDLESRCDECTWSVEEENSSLNYRCLSGYDYEACRRLQRIMTEGCRNACNPWERCRTCMSEVNEEEPEAAAYRQIGSRCRSACR